jgi:hypothetical protein
MVQGVERYRLSSTGYLSVSESALTAEPES